MQETASAGTERQSSKKPPGKKPKSAAPSVPPPVAKQPAGKPKRKKVMVEEVGKESEARGVEPVAVDVPETKGDVVREKMSNIKQEKVSLQLIHVHTRSGLAGCLFSAPSILWILKLGI